MRAATQEIRARRAELRLSARDRALVMLDQAGAHMSKTYAKIQAKWCERNNVAPQHSKDDGF